MLIDRLEGNSELKTSVRLMLGGRRMTHSVLLVGEEGLGTGFAARCVAADYLYPNGGAPAEALLRGECCRAVAKAGKRDSGQIETGKEFLGNPFIQHRFRGGLACGCFCALRLWKPLLVRLPSEALSDVQMGKERQVVCEVFEN